jgi:GDP-4-dehydro-6-deoxy-D-mannose reductase
MRALVVGADGFVGRWLVRHLAASGDTVAGIVGPRYRPPLEGVEAVHAADVRNAAAIRAAVSATAPDAVYYLAAVSQAGGREDVAAAAGIAVVGSVNALVACAELRAGTRFLYVSSAHVYGRGGSDGPLDESAPVRPANVYGAAKAAAESALLRLAEVSGIQVVVARPFNHIGPGQRPPFLVPQLVAQVRDIPAGGHGVIRVGAAGMVRDYTDVRDVVRAYRVLVERGEAGGIYNVASGTGTSVRAMVDALVAVSGVEAELVEDPAIDRSGDATRLVGDASRLAGLRWRPERDLRSTLADVLSDAAIQAGA